jgi:hypothetical protein
MSRGDRGIFRCVHKLRTMPRSPRLPAQTRQHQQSLSTAAVLGRDATAGDGGRITLDEILDSLDWQDTEYTAVCHKLGGHFYSSVVESPDASACVARLSAQADAWFSVNPTAGPAREHRGRGDERHVTRWAALCLDVDVKERAFPNLGMAAEFISTLSGMVETRPTGLIYSGHGIQPLWPIEDGELDNEEKWARAYRLSRRFGRLANRVASDFSARLDNVSDLARIVRVPGSTNWKDPANPAPVYAMRDSGGPLTVDRVEEFLDAWAPEIDSDQPVAGGVVSPAHTWKFGSSTCAYVAAMVRSSGRPSDQPKAGRHQWAMARCVRLAAAHRLGCITRDGLDQALAILESALKHWCQMVGVPRDLAPDEIGSAYRWAAARVAIFNDQRARSELGHHQHCSAHARRWTMVRT